LCTRNCSYRERAYFCARFLEIAEQRQTCAGRNTRWPPWKGTSLQDINDNPDRMRRILYQSRHCRFLGFDLSGHPIARDYEVAIDTHFLMAPTARSQRPTEYYLWAG